VTDAAGGLLAAVGAAVAAQAALRLWLAGRQIRALERHRNHVPAPFAGRITLPEQQKGADYAAARVRLGRWAAVQDAILVLALTVGGGIAALIRRIDLLAWPAPWSGVLLVFATLALLQLAGLPFACWRTFRLEQRFGFNRTTAAQFVLDRFQGWGVACALGIPLLAAVLLVMERAGPAWWLWAWAMWFTATLLLTWAMPLLIAPLFNNFVPLADPVVLTRVQGLLKRCGFTADGGVFVMDGSRRSAHGNAYFTGFGRAKRIVVFDTLLERMNADEVEAILTHELGHFRLHHLRQRLMVSALMAALAFAVLAWCAGQGFIFAAFGISAPTAAAALLLFITLSPVVSYFVTPLEAWWSRRHEREADRFAAAHSSAAALSAALIKLYRDNADALAPDLLYAAFYYSHPTALERIGWLDALEPGKPAAI
jgi:STE24 endopeptidase